VNIKNHILPLLLLLSCQQILGQSVGLTPDSVAASVALLRKHYSASAVDYPQLFIGSEYVDYSKRYYKSIGHQFFLSNKPQIGTADYNNHYFTNLNLYYDVVLDQVVLQQEANPFTVRLIDENVRRFTIADHQFVRLVADSLSSPTIRTGYYELLLDSTVQVLAKRLKRQQEKISEGRVNIEFTSIDRLFIKKAGRYYPVSSKGSVTRLFSDHGKEVQKYIQANKLKFKKARRETDIIQLTRYYNSLAAQ
jgi:hypothetical protein